MSRDNIGELVGIAGTWTSDPDRNVHWLTDFSPEGYKLKEPQ